MLCENVVCEETRGDGGMKKKIFPIIPTLFQEGGEFLRTYYHVRKNERKNEK